MIHILSYLLNKNKLPKTIPLSQIKFHHSFLLLTLLYIQTNPIQITFLQRRLEPEGNLHGFFGLHNKKKTPIK